MFDFVDLFSGIGGFHGALERLGGNGVQAAEIDPRAREVYKANWRLQPDEDVRHLAADPADRVKDHAVLAGGFPCQPFSKSGRQRGMGEERGTLFHDVIKILEVKRPPVVFLENVRNIAGPRQRETWQAVVEGLRNAGYAVSSTPCVFSPHLLRPESGGAAQIRERVYILGTYVGADLAMRMTDVDPVVQNRPEPGWNPKRDWSIERHVVSAAEPSARLSTYNLSDEEILWVETWNDLLKRLGPDIHIPGHPLWADVWTGDLEAAPSDPDWKRSFIANNLKFLAATPQVRDWVSENQHIFRQFPPSRRKLEWQAQDAPRDLRRLLLHFRPSGIRAKQPTYAPALVAMGQTSVYGDGTTLRKLTVQEAAVLQGFPHGFKFGAQVDSISYRQLGNAINVGTARYVFAKYVDDNAELIGAARQAGAGADGRPVVESVRAWRVQQETEAVAG